MHSSFRLAVGIDVAKDTLAVAACSMTTDGPRAEASHEVENTASGHDQLLAWLARQGVEPGQTHVVMEATNVYWELCALALVRAGYVVTVANPAQTAHFAKSTLMRGKSDRMDARLLAQYASEKQPRPWLPPTTELEELQVLVQRREALIHMRVEEQSRLHSLKHRAHSPVEVRRQIEQHIEYLTKQIDRNENDTRVLLRSDQTWAKNFALLNSIAGIGFVTASTLMARLFAVHIPDTPRQATAFAGLAPAPNQSGTSLRGRPRISKIGDPYLRKILYMAAMSAAKHNPRLRAFYDSLVARQKVKKVAQVAVARKLLITAYAVVTSAKPYDPNYVRPSNA